MEPTIGCGKHLVKGCDMAGSRFEDVCLGNAEFDNVSLAGARFENVNLAGVKFHNVNFSDAVITAANLGGATLRHIGPAADEKGEHQQQRPVLFTEADFNGSRFENVNLANVEINNCNIEGMKIDGVDVCELVREQKRKIEQNL